VRKLGPRYPRVDRYQLRVLRFNGLEEEKRRRRIEATGKEFIPVARGLDGWQSEGIGRTGDGDRVGFTQWI
jgi:hypothetical protein